MWSQSALGVFTPRIPSLSWTITNKTKKNILENPRVALTFWDPESRKSFQLKGSAVIETSGKIFTEEVMKYKARRPNSNPRGVVIIKIEEIYITEGGPDAGKRIA